MEFLQTLSLVFTTIICILLVFLVLIQAGKGGSMGILGGGSSTTPFGASATDIVTKLTWWLGAIFFGLAIFAGIVFADAGPDKPPASVEDTEQLESQQPQSDNTPKELRKSPR